MVLINIPGFDNETPLHDAVVNNKVKVVKLLVSRAPTNVKDNAGWTPLVSWSFFRSLLVSKLILKLKL